MVGKSADIGVVGIRNMSQAVERGVAMKAIGTTAKASFTSHRSTLSLSHPIRASSFSAAGTGAVGNWPGAWAWLA